MARRATMVVGEEWSVPHTLVQACLDEVIVRGNSLYDEMLGTLLDAPSSPLWAALSYWSGIAVGLPPTVQASVTAALLLGRRASALLDDAQDRDRPLPLNPAQALNATVGLAFTSHLVLGSLPVAAPLQVLAQTEYTRTVLQMCRGQYEETARSHLALTDYEQVVENKTASYCSLECRLPSLLAGVRSSTVEGFSAFGQAIGHLYQVMNDFQGFHGMHGRCDVGTQWTWPCLYAIHSAPTDDVRAVLYGYWERQEVEAFRSLAIELGASHYVLLLATHHHTRATEVVSWLTTQEGLNLHALERLRAVADALYPSLD